MPKTLDIAALDINSLKVLAYDTSALLNLHRQNLQIVENEIAKRIQEAEAGAAKLQWPAGPPGPPGPAGIAGPASPREPNPPAGTT
jgi:hypothetical protein